jgi:hypothetical protein
VLVYHYLIVNLFSSFSVPLSIILNYFAIFLCILVQIRVHMSNKLSTYNLMLIYLFFLLLFISILTAFFTFKILLFLSFFISFFLLLYSNDLPVLDCLCVTIFLNFTCSSLILLSFSRYRGFYWSLPFFLPGCAFALTILCLSLWWPRLNLFVMCAG